MRSLIQRFALWLLSLVATDARYLIVPNDDLLKLATALTEAQDALYPDRSGEAKNHQVRAALMKHHPHAGQRQISLAIEAALGD